MTNSNFTTSITVDKSAAEVFEAINNVHAWWHGEIDGNANKIDDEFHYRFADVHYSKQKVVEIIPNKKIVWLVTDSNIAFTKSKNEWTGTKIVFDISESDNKTQILFTHEGLVPSFECYGDCSNGWSMLIHESLNSLLNTGKGKEVFG